MLIRALAGGRWRGAFHRNWRGTGRNAPGARHLPQVQRRERRIFPGSTRAPESIPTTPPKPMKLPWPNSTRCWPSLKSLPAAKSASTIITRARRTSVQRAGLIRQLEIAAARKRPILIHCRGTNESTDAWDDLLLVLEERWRSNRPWRHHALLRRWLGAGAPLAGSWFSGLFCRQFNLSQGAAAPRCCRPHAARWNPC